MFNVMELAQQVVDQYAEVMAKDLGITEDGILNRIVVSDEIVTQGKSRLVRGRCYAEGERHGFSSTVKYVEGSAYIKLYPFAFISYFTRKNELKRVHPIVLLLLKRRIRSQLIFCLAHEMRHTCQYVTNKSFNERFLGVYHVTTYENRWVEKDADEYANNFLKTKGR